MEERSMEYRQMKQRGDRTMRELGTARRLLMEEIREKKSVANSGKCKRVHSGRVRVRTASDVLSDRDWDRMNGHIRIYQLGRPLTRRQFLALPEDLRRKIALFCNMEEDCVIQNLTASTLYEVPLLLEREGLCRVACRKLGLPQREPDLAEWTALVQRINGVHKTVQIALVGKYTGLHDAYLSVAESLFHAGTANNVIVDICWVDSSKLTQENAEAVLGGCAGILVPGGFGDRGIEGMIVAAQYARTHKIPYFGICLGMQIAVIEFARHVLGWEDAHSAEFDEFTKHPVIDIMPEQKSITQKGGTMRLGAYPCVLSEGSRAAALYGKTEISERHRHRYEFCNDFRDAFVAAGLVPTGLSPDGRLVEIVELPDHPWFTACQFHPEFKSRPDRPHPLFFGFVEAAASRI